MAEYIERETFLKDIEERYCLPCKEAGRDHNGCKCRACWVDDMRGDVIDEPAADVAPVRHGRWIFGKDLPYSWGQMPKNKYHLYCSECLEQAFNRSEDNDPDFDVDTPYCPICGAIMDGKCKESAGE